MVMGTKSDIFKEILYIVEYNFFSIYIHIYVWMYIKNKINC